MLAARACFGMIFRASTFNFFCEDLSAILKVIEVTVGQYFYKVRIIVNFSSQRTPLDPSESCSSPDDDIDDSEHEF